MGLILIIESALMVLPLLICLTYRENDWPFFLMCILGCLVPGIPLYLIKCDKKTIHAAEGYLIVGLAWIILSAVAAAPFVAAGYIPSFLDAMFETVSGFTTTGVTIMDNVEILSHSMQFWRIFTHWVGGMGILVFMMAITPVAGRGTAIHMLKAESPGPTTEKISPKISAAAKYLYLIYIGLTIIQIITLMISGMDVFHSALVAFGTMGTGGFSYMNTSMATVTIVQRSIITVFMLLAGANFSLYFLILTGKVKDALKNEELRWYGCIYVLACAIITFSTFRAGCFSTVRETVHYVTFSIASLMTTTGYSACDMNAWPWFAKNLTLLLMIIGACAGSTAGGIKVSRMGIALKSIRNSLKRLIHPRSVSTVRYNGKELPINVIQDVLFYLLLYVLIYSVSMIVICIDPKADFITAFSAVDTTINNNGIGFAWAAGPFSGFAWYSKVVFILDMLIGRLEIFPILILLDMIISPAKYAGRRAVKGARKVFGKRL